MRIHKCPCCNGDNISCIYSNSAVKPISNWKQFFYGNFEFIHDLYKCNDCSYRFIDTITENYTEYYIHQELDDNTTQDAYRIPYFQKIKHKTTILFNLKNKNKKILDIGCSKGIWLDQWRNEAELFGIEYSSQHIDYLQSKNISVVKPDELINQSFDIISLFDVLEHLEDPYDYLIKIKSLLKPNGVIVIGVPDMGKLLARMLGKRYYLVCPMHFSYFNHRSLKLLLERTLQGKIIVEQSPSMNTDLKGLTRWLNFIPTPSEFFNVSIPIPYKASLIAYIQLDNNA